MHALVRTFQRILRLRGLLCLVLSSMYGMALAQGTGIIRGQVLDGESSEPLIGATVLVEGTSLGANTDLDGNYTISNVPLGTYALKISFLSYEDFRVTEVQVVADRVAVVNGVLQPEGTSIGEVVITARQLRNNEASLLNIQRTASQTLDGLGARQISRIGDSDAGVAVRRVVGVTVEGGRYVYVRGLGDRYSKTLLNGAEIPGLDPNRTGVQIDLFPTNLIDNVIVYKSYTPDLPGNFAGGLLDISTRDFPNQFSIDVNVQAGYNTQATFNDDFLTEGGKSLDFLGLGSRDRELNGQLRAIRNDLTYRPLDNSLTGLPRANAILNATSNDVWVPTRDAAPVDHQLNFSVGNQSSLFGKQFGYIFSGTYRRQYSYFDGEAGIYQRLAPSSTTLTPRQQLTDQQGVDEVLWGLLGTFSLKLNDRNKVSLNLIWNQGAEARSRYLQGLIAEQFTPAYQIVQAIDYQERANRIAQLRGTHLIGERKVSIEWIASGSLTTLDQPDYRVFGVNYSPNTSGEPQPGTYATHNNQTGEPIRFARQLDEYDYDARLHVTYPFQFFAREAKFKIGGAVTYKDRSFEEQQYALQQTGVSETDQQAYNNFANNPERWLAAPNLRLTSTPLSGFVGFFYDYRENFVNNYDGQEFVPAAYLMFDLPLTEKLRAVLGARYERTDIELTYVRNETGLRDIDDLKRNDILPALSLIYALNDEMNIRLNGSTTLARPNLREIARFTQFDFFAGPQTVGNPELDRTLIYSGDVRYEFFPNPTEIFAVSAFVKYLDEPIERAFQPIATKPTITWRNVPEAVVFGAEFEVRKSLSFLAGNFFKYLQVGANVSFIYSEVDIPEEEVAAARSFNPDPPKTRELFGQSPYLVNAVLAYINPEKGASYTLAFNVIGERLILVAPFGSPNYYEQPRPTLDLNILQRIGSSPWTLRVGAQNILNPDVAWTSEFNGQEYDFTRYKEGTRLIVGVNYNFTR